MVDERPSPMRIALVSSSYHPYVGGVEEHVRQVALELASRGHSVVVWTVDRGEHLGVQTVDGVLVRYLPTPLPATRPGAVVRFARTVGTAYRAWLAAAVQDRPQLLHVHCFGPNGVYAVALATRLGLPLGVTSHGETTADDHDAYGQSWLLRTSLTRALHQAAIVTAPSTSVLVDLRSRFGLLGGSVVPNGVPLDAPAEPEPLPDPDRERPRPLIVAVGRVEHVKGFDVAVRALPEVLSSYPEAHLRIGGDGSASPALRALADDHGIGASVEHVGWLSAPAVAAALADADVVVVPSRREAFGIVLLEAWRSGTPVVASRVDGLAELVTDGESGLLVPPDDPAALARGILAVLNDPSLAARLSVGGLAAVQRYSWTSVVNAYEALYRAQPPATPPRSPRRWRR